MSTVQDPTVVMDSGYVSDGHSICWNGMHGAFIGHSDECPYYTEDKMRVYLCSPGLWASANGCTLDDLDPQEAAHCRQSDIGTEPIKWRLQEFLNPNFTVAEQKAMSIFEIMLDD